MQQQPNMQQPYTQQDNMQQQSYTQQPYTQQENAQQQYTQQQPYMQQPYVQPQPQQKSKIAAALIAIFFGYLGIHNFYLGYTGKAVAQLVLFLFTCGTVSEIWAWIEAIMILTGSINTDGKGIPLKD